MNFITANTGTVNHVLPAGVVTTYVQNAVSLYVTFNGITTRYDVTVTNATADTSGSLVTTTDEVDFTGEGLYVLKFVEESNIDLDTASSGTAVTLTTIVTGTARRIIADSTVTL